MEWLAGQGRQLAVTTPSLEQRTRVSRDRIKEGIAMLKVVVLALGLAVVFLSQTEPSPGWLATCANSECVVGP
jgi:hypothetical protein